MNREELSTCASYCDPYQVEEGWCLWQNCKEDRAQKGRNGADDEKEPPIHKMKCPNVKINGCVVFW